MSPVKFLFTFLLISIILWLFVIFASRLVALFLSRIMKASVGFRVSGWKSLRDVTIKFEKGAVESVSVGEIRLSIRQSLVKLGVGFISRDPKLQLLISDLEIVTRTSNKSTKKTTARKSHGSRSSSGKGKGKGKGKWMAVANMARFISISVSDLLVKTPKAAVEIKDLGIDISKEDRSKPSVCVKLQLLPIAIHLGEPRFCDQLSSFSSGESFSSGQAGSATTEKASAPFFCEEFSLSCEFGHNREAGIVVKNVDVSIGEITLNLNEELIPKKKQQSDIHADEVLQSSVESDIAKKQQKKEAQMAAISKSMGLFPEKVSFNLPKLNAKFVHKEHCIVMENNIMGIQLKIAKSRSIEDVGESTRLDLQLDFSEIHLLKEAENSVVDILKLSVISSVYIPLQPSSPIRSEVDIKLGGTKFNIFMGRLKPLIRLRSSKKKKMMLKDETENPVKAQSTGTKAIMWTCTFSAPEMTIVLFNLSGSPIYHGCSQSSHVFANNISSTGTTVHAELGELNLHMADEYQECLRESLFGVETNTGSILHIAKISVDWGKKDTDSVHEDGSKSKLVLAVDVTSVGLYFTFRRVESLASTAFSFKALLKSSSVKTSAQSRVQRSNKPSGKGVQLIKFNLEKCSVNLSSDVGLENEVVDDPKRVNYGSQGGRVLISVLQDGTPRTAKVASTVADEYKSVKYSVCLDLIHLSLCLNKEKQTTQVELERARSVYQEYLEDSTPGTKVALFDMQNAKFVRRAGGLKEIAVCSLFSATDITVRWEPDVHLGLVELGLKMKLLVHNQKLQEQDNYTRENELKKDDSLESVQSEKHQKKKESLFAVDVEMLTITAEAGDGVETMVQVRSIFSENARIGVLIEGLMLSFNAARVFKSGRLQVSRIPSASSGASDVKAEPVVRWDIVIQALDVHICMPFRLQLRALDDSIEEMLRALKLVAAAKTKIIFPFKKESAKPKKPSSSKIGCVKFFIRKITADIEEEPLQGWLDEHYRLMRNEARELAVRLSFLEELVSKGRQSPAVTDTDDSVQESKLLVDGEENDVQDASSIEKSKEEIYKQSFRSYFQACQSRVISEGSGACREGFQSGFKFSTSRTSLFSITATELDLTLTAIEGGEEGMIEVVQKLDPVALEYKIPFARLYGSNLNLKTSSLVVQLRDYTCPLLAAYSGKCEGRLVLAQQATPFQPQILHEVYIGRWRKVQMYRSVSGTTPPMKTFLDLPLHFQKGEVAFGVGFEPPFADLSYAFTVALRRANLSVRNPNATDIMPPKKEKSLPWWDEMRNYIHGKTTLMFSETIFNILATTDPYENADKLQIFSGYMEIQQSDGRVHLSAKEFKIFMSSLESLLRNSTIKPPAGTRGPFLVAPTFTVEVTMDWECDSGTPLNHYLFALPAEAAARERIFDPFRSTALSLRWSLSLRPPLSSDNQSQSSCDTASYGISKLESDSINSPIINVGPHDFAWLIKFWNLNYLPPHKLRYFSRWPRFGVPRIPRSGNLSLDKVMTEFMFRIDSTPTCLRHISLDDNDPAKGLTFKMTKLKFEMCFGRGKQKFTFESNRGLLDLVYQGVDLHMPKVFLNKDDSTCVIKVIQMTRKSSQSASMDGTITENSCNVSGTTERPRDDGFLLTSDYFTIRRQSPKADSARLLAWQEAGRRNLEMTYVRSEFENGSDSDEQARSDQSDDDGYNVVIADNCQRIFVYGLKLLWNIENRNAVWSWVGELSKAFAPPRPSPSRQYAQRKLLEETQDQNKSESVQEDVPKTPSNGEGATSSSSPKQKEASSSDLSPPNSTKAEPSSTKAEPSSTKVEPSSTKVESQPFDIAAKLGNMDDSEEEGTRHFMVNVIEPQFNLHSEDANGRFLLAAASGRVLARSFHAVINVGHEIIGQALGSADVKNPECQPELTWNRMELSVMLEHVQAHVAPTDVDPGAGIQWLPKIRKSSPKVKRTGALLERVFMPCDMYFRYTRHKGGTADLKVKPLKELAFNSHNITATMTSRQFQVMLDVLTNLLFARPPKPRKSSLPRSAEDDDDMEEEADEVVPDGVEEVELERVNLEQKERVLNLLFDDIRKLSLPAENSGEVNSEKEGNLWMVTGGRATLVQRLKKELVNAQKSRKIAAASLRTALQKAAQQRLVEKEKNKSPSCAMRISLQINKVVWGMLLDGKSFAEAEINDLIYDFDRDYKDVGVARFTTKYIVVRNCLPNAKSDMLLSAWNPPPEWGKKVMLRVDARQGAPKDGNSPLELFQVDIYPLRIYLTETMYRMMWEYFFPEEEQDSQRRQEVWKVSTTAGLRRAKKGSIVNDASTKELEGSSKSSGNQALVDRLQSSKTKPTTPELRRTSSFDRSWEETVAESVADELLMQMHSSSISRGPLGDLDESNKSKSKDAKTAKAGRSQEEKKLGKPGDEKRSRPRVMREFHNIKISQVELLVTYEGSRFAVSDLRLLMDAFHRAEFTGTWRRLFSRVKKHIIWGVLKSVTGMQGKKFKDKLHIQGKGKEKGPNVSNVPTTDLILSDPDDGSGNAEGITWPKRPADGAGDGFVTSIRGLFHSQRRKAKAFVLRTMRGEGENDPMPGDWSESDMEYSPFARQLTITKARKLIRRHTKKFRSKKGLDSSLPSSPRETTAYESDSSSGSDNYEELLEEYQAAQAQGKSLSSPKSVPSP